MKNFVLKFLIIFGGLKCHYNNGEWFGMLNIFIRASNVMEEIMRDKILNIIRIVMSNMTTIIAGIIVGFIIPKILSIEDFGYFKAFTLYATYIGFFSLGIIDGIVLKHGNENYEDINKLKFRSYFIWYSIVHVFFTILILIISIYIIKGEYKYIIALVSVNIIALNFAGYFQQISQITQRFNEFSKRNVVRSILTIMSVIILYTLYSYNVNVNYKMYVILILITNYILTIWYITTYRDLIFGPNEGLKKVYIEIIQLIKIGFPLLFANLCATLILTIDRQFINIFFGNKEFALYAFAYNMLALITVATTAISIVLYPTLKRSSVETLKYYYSLLVVIMLILLFGSISVYFPLISFIEWYLPNYVDSLIVLRIILPGLVISSIITVVMHNYYKTLNDNLMYFKKTVLILITSIIMNFIALYIFENIISISIASIITMILWYFYVENYFVTNYKYKPLKNASYMVIMTTVFYSTTFIDNNYLGLTVYIILFITISIIFFHQLLKGNFNNLLKRKDSI